MMRSQDDIRRLRRLFRHDLVVSPVELDAIDDYRFAKRLPNRAAAIRQLMARGMSAPPQKAEGG
jgi:hypothetical protein